MQTEEITKEIEKMLTHKGWSWGEVLSVCKKNNIWQEVKGMWAEKKIDPLKYEKKIRKEWERTN